MKNRTRVRFAPSPTGTLHLGNIRTALLNYLFAKHNKGDFVLRIEDTDTERHQEKSIEEIINGLSWLGICSNEGFGFDGSYGPYRQSERKEIYKEALDELIDKKRVYRCFCSQDELEEKRKAQITRKEPPRYDRNCLRLTSEEVDKKIELQTKFVWRFRLDENKIIKIRDMARGEMVFNQEHFTDFTVTRQDGSFTFLFTNCVDDWKMEITHVIRGEDHLSNTSSQAALLDAFGVEIPIFWHLPMLCDENGQKLSKRKSGFPLRDLKEAGYLPNAIVNYLATAGGSFKKEIQDLDELSKNYPFNSVKHSGNIKYDAKKLIWFNREWIKKIEEKKLWKYMIPFISKFFEPERLNETQKNALIGIVKNDIDLLKDIESLVKPCFIESHSSLEELKTKFSDETLEMIFSLLKKTIENSEGVEIFLSRLKEERSNFPGLKNKDLFSAFRYILCGCFSGIGVQDACNLIGIDEIKRRVAKILPNGF